MINPPDTPEKGSILKQKLVQVLDTWENIGTPSRTGLKEAARELIAWKRETRVSGLWRVPRRMVTATIDDAWGNGIRLINLWAEAIGFDVHFLGVLQPPPIIIEKCREIQPDLLGLTVLQFDSEELLVTISRNLPSKTRIIAGGPLFSADPELAYRSGVHFVARNAADFIGFILDRFAP
jgi:methylmalonyl-CoA mutase cobalamin-binding subunit